MVTKFYKNISDLASGVCSKVREFKKTHSDEDVYSAGVAKRSILSASDNVLDLKNWKSVTGGTAILTEGNVYFKDQCYKLSDARTLELIKFQNLYGFGQIIKYVGSDGTCTCFSMQYDPVWSEHSSFQGKIKEGKLKGLSRIILIFIVIAILWILIYKFL